MSFALEKLHIYLTNRCNSCCKHCWILAGPQNHDFLKASDIIPLIDQALLLGLKMIKITGGEPFLFRDELRQIALHAAQLKLAVHIESNATVIEPADFVWLKESKAVIYSSLDGSKKDVHDRFRGKKAAFEQTVQNLKMLIQQGIDVHVISCLHRENVDESFAIVDLCEQMGARSVKFNFPSPYGRGIQLEKQGHLLSTKEIIQWVAILEKRERTMPLDFDVPRIFRTHASLKRRCSILNLLSILPDGRFSICGIGVTYRELTFGHIARDSLQKVWEENETLQFLRQNLPQSPQGVCAKCKEYPLCYNHCLAYVLTKTGSLLGPHPMCQEAFADPVPE